MLLSYLPYNFRILGKIVRSLYVYLKLDNKMPGIKVFAFKKKTVS